MNDRERNQEPTDQKPTDIEGAVNPVHLTETELDVPKAPVGVGLLEWLTRQMDERLPSGHSPLRLVVTETHGSGYRCEVTVLVDDGSPSSGRNGVPHAGVSEFRPRLSENTAQFNAALLVPTGIGAAIGGHAGDATPVARLLASVCDTLVTHPNVVNASDINEMPANALYVEGSVVCRLLMGTAGLQPVRANRVLAVVDAHANPLFTELAVNAVNAAHASYGLLCPSVVALEPPLVMRSEYTDSSRAAGRVEDIDRLFAVLDARTGEFDAVALSSVISVPFEFHSDYFTSDGGMVNPWGGVEAMLTHAISSRYDVPSAHSPMLESQEVLDLDVGVVDPRMAAEAVSMTFLQSVLKGLQRSPRIVTDREAMREPHVLTARDVSCLVLPQGCLGLPTLAALEQGIAVIEVAENANLMRNDLSTLPWRQGQFHRVANYWEAAGVMAALKAGVSPASVRRPLAPVKVQKTSY